MTKITPKDKKHLVERILKEAIQKLSQWQVFIISALTIAVTIACMFDPSFSRVYLISYLAAIFFITVHFYTSGRYLR